MKGPIKFPYYSFYLKTVKWISIFLLWWLSQWLVIYWRHHRWPLDYMWRNLQAAAHVPLLLLLLF